MLKSFAFLAIPSLVAALIISSCATAKVNVYPLEKGYLREEQLYPRLKEISGLNPALTRLRVIGFSGTDEIPLYALEIGNADAPHKILIIGQHHGEEVLGIQLSVELAREITRKWKQDRYWKAILEEYQIWIIPTINPEGWRTVSSGEYHRKRKNNRDTDKNGKLDIRTDGIDLNRNYPVFWADQPPEPPSSPYYKGERPASEPEIQAVINLADKNTFELAFFYHSSASGAFSETIYLPAWVASDKEQEAQINSLMDFARGYAKSVKKDYRKGHYLVGEGNSSRVGNARNYFFHTHGTDAMLIEIGGINQEGISVIHPPAAMMQKIVAKHIAALRKSIYQRMIKK